MQVTGILKKTTEISTRIALGWTILAKQWVVERTFAWLNQFPRLSKDYEIIISSAENNVIIVQIILVIKSLSYL